jgi:lipopolysaccharide/colanic/teichoic acid biosynthesis glycosyltransferase
LEREIIKRMRETDQVGRLNGNQVWTILPYTSLDGARVFSDEICQRAARQRISPEYTIDMYPRDPDVRDEGRHRVPGDRVAVSELRSGVAPETSSPSPLHTRLAPVSVSFAGAAAGRDGSGQRGSGLPLPFDRPIPLWKRALDVVGAATGLVLFSPLMLGAALATKLSSPGPVLFVQMRAGLGGRPFRFYKFRTMVVNAEELKEALVDQNEVTGPVFKIKKDPRITRVGQILRKTSIDELPQLWNVLRGDMSLVGPRPLPVSEAEACLGWQRRCLDVTPGLTCTWQISGRCEVEFSDWVRMDIGYTQGCSLSRDIGILLRTVPAVLSQRGAY